MKKTIAVMLCLSMLLGCFEIREEEVDEIFLTPVTHLMEARIDHYPETVRARVPEDFPFETVGIDENYKWRYGKWTIPVSVIDGRVFWGLTLWITEHMIHQLSE